MMVTRKLRSGKQEPAPVFTFRLAGCHNFPKAMHPRRLSPNGHSCDTAPRERAGHHVSDRHCVRRRAVGCVQRCGGRITGRARRHLVNIMASAAQPARRRRQDVLAEKRFRRPDIVTPAFIGPREQPPSRNRDRLERWNQARWSRFAPSRPQRHALAAIMPASTAFCRRPRPMSLSAHGQPIRSESPAPVYQAVRRDPYPDAGGRSTRPAFHPVRRGLSRHHRLAGSHSAWRAALPTSGTGSAGRQGWRAARGDERAATADPAPASALARSAGSPWHGRRPGSLPPMASTIMPAEGSDWPTSSLTCARCRRCNEAIAKQPVPSRRRGLYSVRTIEGERLEVPPQ